MKEIIVRSWCDIAASHDEKVEANPTPYTLSFNGISVDLDLCEQGVKEITEALAPFMALGRKRVQVAAKPGRKAETGPGSRSDMRAWGIKHGFKIPKNRGGYYYSTPLKEAYAQHLAEIGTPE